MKQKEYTLVIKGLSKHEFLFIRRLLRSVCSISTLKASEFRNLKEAAQRLHKKKVK